MDKNNKKIEDNKRMIKEEKKKIKSLKRDIRNIKKNKFKKTKFGKFLKRSTGFFSDERNTYSFSEVFVITLISLVLGAFACVYVLTIISGGRNYLKLSKELSKFYDAYDTLVDNYYGDLSKEELVDNAISGMVSSVGDVYTNYADSDETNKFNELVNGVYEGLGCTIQQVDSDTVKVALVYEDSPAEKAGIKEGDLIKKIDELDATEGINRLSEYIKKEATGDVKIVISRDNEEKTITLKRGTVEIPVVSTEVFTKNDKKIGYLKISIFSSVAAKQFENRLKELEKQGIDALVIDVRDNNGGYLTTVTDIASSLLPKGKNIYQIQKDNKKVATKDKTSTKREYPIAIIVNGNSASASEILAGAIKESYNGYVVGTKTYGKGTVQQVKTLGDGSMIKYTIENWLTPDGNWINEKGIEPTDEVELSKEYYENPTNENDNQLQKALEVVSK